MQTILYILKFSIVLAGLYLIWKLIASRKTDPSFDRIFMLLAPISAVLIPFIKLPIFLKGKLVTRFHDLPEVEVAMSYISDLSISESDVISPAFNVISLIKWTFIIAGVIVLIILLHSIYLKIKLIRNHEINNKNGLKIVSVGQKILPFSFINYVFLNPLNYDSESLDVILRHEKAHVKQFHYIDVIYFELLKLVLWFHPVYWLMKKKLVASHEYLADNLVLTSGVERIKYMNLILSHLNYNTNPGIGISFSKLITIKRIKMMNTQNNTKIIPRILLSIAGSFILIALLSFSFSNPEPELIINVSNLTKASDPPPDISPLDLDKVKFTSGFGMRMHPIKKIEMLHKGIDFAAPAGTNVIATLDGVIVSTDHKPKGAGRYITIKHNESYTTFYSQLQEILVEMNQVVKKGDVIGKVGSSGVSTGPHLHYEVRLNGKAVDPEGFLGK